MYSSVSKSSTFTEIVGLRGLSTPAQAWRLWCITCARERELLLFVFYSLECIPSSLRCLLLNLSSTNPGPRAHEAGSLPVFFLCSFRLALFPSLSLFISPSVSLPSLSFIFLLVCSSYKGGVKLRNELSRNDAFFSSARDREKKREIHQNSIIHILFQQPCDPVKMVSPFRLFGLFFSFFVSLFRLLTSASKEAAPFESESRERERALLPSWCIFPNTKKSSQHDDCERRRDIYTNTYTRHTKHIAILYDSQ